MRRVLLAFLLSLLLPLTAESVVYWVSATGGSTAANCAAADSASEATDPGVYVRTLHGGLACLAPGDTLMVKPGTYNQHLDKNIVSGPSPTNRTIVKSQVLHGAVITGVGSASDIVWMGSQENISIEGFDLHRQSGGGQVIRIQPVATGIRQTRHIRFLNNIIHANASSTLNCIGQFWRELGNHHVDFIGNEVKDCGNDNLDHGIYITGTDHIIEGNTVHDVSGHGIHIQDPLGGTGNIHVRGNFIYNNGSNCVIVGHGSDNRVYNNTCWNNGALTGVTGIRVAFGGPSNTKIYNNTIVGSNGSCIYLNSDSSNTTVRNNICLQNDSDSITNLGTGLVQSNNLFGVSPPFVNQAGGNFALAATATAAIDKGITTIATGIAAAGADDPNVPNASGSGVDIGAYQTFRAVSASVSGSTVTVNLDNVFQPMRGGDLDDLALTVNGVAQTKSGLVRGNNTLSFAIGTTPSNTATVQLAHTPDATDPFRDSACSGGGPFCVKSQRWNAQTIAVQVVGGQPVNPVLTVGPGQVERWNTTGVSSPPPPAAGNTVLVDATTTVQGSGSTINISHTTATSADLAVVEVVLGSNTVTVSSATAGGFAASPGDRAAHATAALSGEWWARTSPPTGSNIAYVINLSGSTTYKATVTTYREVHVASPYDLGAKVTTGTGNVSTNVSSVPGDLVCDVVGQLTPLGGSGSCEAAAATTTMSWASSDSAAPRVHLTMNINADPGMPQPDPPTVVIIDAESVPQLGVSAQGQFTHTSGTTAKLATIDVCQDGTATVDGPTYGGVAMAQVARQVHATLALACDVWELVNPPTGAQEVIVPFSAATEFIIVARTYNGSRVPTPISGALTTTGNDLAPSLTVTSKAADLVVSVVGAGQPSTTIAPGTGETERYDEPNSTFFRSAGYTQPGATPSVVMAPPLGVAGGYVMIAYNINQFEEEEPVEDPVITQHHYTWCEPDQPEGVRCVPHDTETKIPMGGRAMLRTALGITVADAMPQAYPIHYDKNLSETWLALDDDTTKDAWLCHDTEHSRGETTVTQLPLDGRTFAGGAFYVKNPGDTTGEFPPVGATVGQQLEFGISICFHRALQRNDVLRFFHFDAQGRVPHGSSVPAVARIRYPAISVR